MHYVLTLHGTDRTVVVEAADEDDMVAMLEDPYATMTTEAGTIVRACWVIVASPVDEGRLKKT